VCNALNELGCSFEQSSSDEDVDEEEEKPASVSDNHDVTSIAKSDITTASEVSVPAEVTELCTKRDFDSDGTTISDVDENGDNDFSQWTDAMDALVASFDVPAESSNAAVASAVNVVGRKSFETTSVSDFPVTSPVRSRAGMMVGNSMSPSAVKRHLESTIDTIEEPPNNRPRQVRDEAIADVQSNLSPLRKALSSTLSLRTS